MGKHRQTVELIAAVRAVLAAQHPMTVRQVHYALVSRQLTENTPAAYNRLIRVLVVARQEGAVPWQWIEDRLRRPRYVSMWDNLGDFAETAVNAYRRNVWATQPGYVEVWLEKDALSGIFEGVLRPYGVTLNVGRGYDGWSSIYEAAHRFLDQDGGTILYFGDFDPSGQDMPRSLGERLAFFEARPEIVVVSLTADDVQRYSLPPDFTKTGDTRRAAFVAKYGDKAVELDALPVDALRGRLEGEIAARMDLDALEQTRNLETSERKQIRAAFGTKE